MNDNQLSEFIKRYVVERELTINDLAKRMNVPHTTVARWVRGDTEPTIKQLVKLSIATGTDLCDLVYMVAPDGIRRSVSPDVTRLAESIGQLPVEAKEMVDAIILGLSLKRDK